MGVCCTRSRNNARTFASRSLRGAVRVAIVGRGEELMAIKENTIADATSLTSSPPRVLGNALIGNVATTRRHRRSSSSAAAAAAAVVNIHTHSPAHAHTLILLLLL